MDNKKVKSIRAIAAKAICRVAYRGDSLQAIQAEVIPKIDDSSRALAYEMIWGTIRHFHALNAATDELLTSPLASKHHDVQSLLLLGIYQLSYMNIPEYAAVSETVSATDDLKKSWARKLVNGCLRTFLRQQDAFVKEIQNKSTLPEWLEKQIGRDWPEQQSLIENAFNRSAPLTLRINPLKISRQDYASKLENNGIPFHLSSLVDSAIILDKNVPITSLPAFAQGEVSIQSESAQMVAKLILSLNNDNASPDILDACAAPGGKACHLLEQIPNAKLDCVEIEYDRVARMQQNFERLNLTANIFIGDASKPNTWRPLKGASVGAPNQEQAQKQYDFVVIDAPCSGTGVISKHPDIKIHRDKKDIQQLSVIQQNLITELWPLVKPHGHLVYLTCSILKQENEAQLVAFTKAHADAEVISLDSSYGEASIIGRQRLPLYSVAVSDNNREDNLESENEPLNFASTAQFDGFYYSVLKKQ